MTRKEELIKTISGDSQNEIKARQLIDEICFIEEQLIEVKKLPFIKVNPKNPEQQKATPASKIYKELLQQYNNSLRLLYRISGELNNDNNEGSPLRTWLKSRSESDAD